MMDRANHTPAAWRPIDRARLQRAPGSGLSAAQWATRVTAGAAAISLGFMVVALVRPLGVPDHAATPTPPVIASMPKWDAALEARQASLALLQRGNYFSAGRVPWPAKPAADQSANADAGTAQAEPPPSLPLALDQLPQDVKAALDNLELKSLHLSRDGVVVASVGYVGAQPGQLPTALRAGDSFKDPKFPQAEWKVESIDAASDSVVLRRGSVKCVLPMYRGGAVAFAPPPRDEMIDGVTVRRETREQVEERLLRSGLPRERVDEALKALDTTLTAERSAAGARPPKDAPIANTPPAERTGELGDAFKKARERRNRPATKPESPKSP